MALTDIVFEESEKGILERPTAVHNDSIDDLVYASRQLTFELVKIVVHSGMSGGING